jgi:hypothetical protein
MSPHVLALPAPSTKGDASGSALSAVPPALFFEYAMNGFATETAQTKRPTDSRPFKLID